MNGMHIDGARFVLNASDFIGTGAIHLPVFEREILDLTRKRGVAFQRIKTKKATGHPTRYFERNVEVNKTAFINPRSITHAMDTVPNRIEKSANIRALVNGITFTKFDVEVTQDQGLYTELQAVDLQEMIIDMGRKQDAAIWTGAATSLTDGASAEYCGLLTQITKTGTIGNTTRIIKAIKTAVAELLASKDYEVKPTAIYLNPMTLDLIENEELDATDKQKWYEVEVVAGIKLRGVMTAAGILPLIPDPFMPIADGGTTNDHRIVIVSEDLLERHYVKSEMPRLYQLGEVVDLSQRFVAVQFDTVIAKAAGYAHAVLTKKVAK